jgi:AbrB family looped-hinge helix DNA binding protein
MAKGKHLLGKRGGRHIFGTVRVGERGQIVIPKEARALFGINKGDTLLVLGDEAHGLFVSKPEVMSSVADGIFRRIGEEE